MTTEPPIDEESNATQTDPAPIKGDHPGGARHDQPPFPAVAAAASCIPRSVLRATFRLRFFYLAFVCLLYSVWRAVDLLVQVELTGDVRTPVDMTSDNTLALLKKVIGIG